MRRLPEIPEIRQRLPCALGKQESMHIKSKKRGRMAGASQDAEHEINKFLCCLKNENGHCRKGTRSD